MSDYIAHHGVKGQRWGVRKYYDENGKLTDLGKRRYAEKEKQADFKRQKALNRQEYKLNKKVSTQKYNQQVSLNEQASQHESKRRRGRVLATAALVAIGATAAKSIMNNIRANKIKIGDANSRNELRKMIKKSKLAHSELESNQDIISHGGKGSGRYPKGFKMAKTIAEETKNATGSVQKAIPSRYNYQVSSHPSYDELSDEYMRKVISRKNLETDYAKAVGELKQKPSKGKIAMEALEIIGAIAAIGVSASVIGLNAMNIDEKSKKKNNK